jgi:hypothetical protein
MINSFKKNIQNITLFFVILSTLILSFNVHIIPHPPFLGIFREINFLEIAFIPIVIIAIVDFFFFKGYKKIEPFFMLFLLLAITFFTSIIANHNLFFKSNLKEYTLFLMSLAYLYCLIYIIGDNDKKEYFNKHINIIFITFIITGIILSIFGFIEISNLIKSNSFWELFRPNFKTTANGHIIAVGASIHSYINNAMMISSTITVPRMPVYFNFIVILSLSFLFYFLSRTKSSKFFWIWSIFLISLIVFFIKVSFLSYERSSFLYPLIALCFMLLASIIFIKKIKDFKPVITIFLFIFLIVFLAVSNNNLLFRFGIHHKFNLIKISYFKASNKLSNILSVSNVSSSGSFDNLSENRLKLMHVNFVKKSLKIINKSPNFLQNRLRLYMMSFAAMLRSPFFGIGYGIKGMSYFEEKSGLYKKFFNGAFNPTDAQSGNMFISAGDYAGLPGLFSIILIYIYFIYMVIMSLKKINGENYHLALLSVGLWGCITAQSFNDLVLMWLPDLFIPMTAFGLVFLIYKKINRGVVQ